MNTGINHDRIAYPKLPDPITAHNLKQLFTPWRDEIEWAFNATYSEEKRLGLLVLLKVFETLGRFITPKEISPEIVRHIAQSAGLAERDSIVYAKRTLARHHQLVRELLNVREWGTSAREVAETTMEKIVALRMQPADLINGAIEALVRECFELPALSTLRRMAGTVQQRIHDEMFEQVEKSFTPSHGAILDALLEVPNDGQESPFTKLCRPPGRATAKNLKALVEHLDWLETLEVPHSALTDIAPVKIEQWADEVRRLTVAELRRYRAPRRHALLLALIVVARGSILDDQVTMLLKSMRKIQHQAQEDLQAWLDERQESSEQLIITLLDLARAHQNNGALGFHHQAAAIIATAGGSDEIVKRCEARLEHRVRDWRPFVRKHFLNRRAALMDLAEVLPLKAMPGSTDLLRALRLIVSLRSQRTEWIDVSPKLDISFLPRSWHKHVRDPDEPDILNRRILEVAVFLELAEALQSGLVKIRNNKPIFRL